MMTINNKTLASLHATLASRTISSADLSLTTQWAVQSLLPYYGDAVHQFKQLDLEFTLSCASADALEKAKSKFAAELVKATLKFDDISLYYDGVLESITWTPVTPEIEDCAVTFIGIASAAEVTVNIASSATSVTVNNPGNLPSPATIAINPGSTMATLSITGLSDEPIVCKNLTSGKIRIIDGASGLVLEDSTNKYPDTELWEFPRLLPGSTTIKLSRSGCTVTIKYKPRHI